MNYSETQVKTHLNDALARIMKLKSIQVDEEMYRLIRQGIEDQAGVWLNAEGGVPYANFAFSELERLDDLHSL